MEIKRKKENKTEQIRRLLNKNIKAHAFSLGNQLQGQPSMEIQYK